MNKIFIDGKEGTTGLKIFERFNGRSDVEVLQISEDKRKDISERKRLINSADIVFLCLPDAASIEAVGLVENPKVKIIDASTAYRTNPEWVYGFPELVGYDKVKNASRVAVPGCHASGFNAIVYPLIKGGIISPDYPIVCHSETGYSGGGKKLIAEYTDKNRSNLYASARLYALNQIHKHQPEMKYICGLSMTPIFNPTLGDYYCGMNVSVPFYTNLFKKSCGVKQIADYLKGFYNGRKFIKVVEYEEGFLPSNLYVNRDDMLITVSGNDERILITAVFDNLGKGASGAAIQCMNIMLGAEETTALILGDK